MTRKYDATQLYVAVLITVLLFAILACVPAHSQLPPPVPQYPQPQQQRSFIPADAPPAQPEVLSKDCPHCSRDWLHWEQVGIKSHPELDEKTQRYISDLRREIVALQSEVRELRKYKAYQEDQSPAARFSRHIDERFRREQEMANRSFERFMGR